MGILPKRRQRSWSHQKRSSDHLNRKKKKKKKDAPDDAAGLSANSRKNKASGAEPIQSGVGKIRDELKVYLGNLPWTVDEAALRADFEKFGEITKIRLPVDAHGKRTGSGYIFYSS